LVDTSGIDKGVPATKIIMKFTTILFLLALCVPVMAQAPAGEPERRRATLAQQKRCDEQAEKQFRKYNPKATPLDDYTSHYDGQAKVCYMMVHLVIVDKGKSVSVSNTVTDAFEGRGYASYIWINSQGKPYQEVAPTDCTVKPRGQPAITCKSSEEFESLVDKYFGIGL
jgi:hypothetical protein